MNNVRHLTVPIDHIDKEAVKHDLLLLMAGIIPCGFDTNFRLSQDGRSVGIELYMEERPRVLERLCAIFKGMDHGKTYPRDAEARGEDSDSTEALGLRMDS